MSISFRHVRVRAPTDLLAELAEFYGSRLGLRVTRSEAGAVAVEVGATTLEFAAGTGEPFYHVAFLVPGDRFEAAHSLARERVDVLPDEATGDEVFDFTNWDAQALYFHDPAGSIVELIAHRGIGETGAAGPFEARELIGISEIGLVGNPPSLAGALERELALEVWSGTAVEEGRLAFVGEKARTLILCRAGRPWLPTGRPAEAHAVEVVLAGCAGGEVPLESGGFVRGGDTQAE